VLGGLLLQVRVTYFMAINLEMSNLPSKPWCDSLSSIALTCGNLSSSLCVLALCLVAHRKKKKEEEDF
jgi:hypothetical protein